MKHLYLENHAYFVTTVTRQREKCFAKNNNCNILIRVLQFYRDRLNFSVFGYVILPDHFHAVIQVPEGLSISVIMHGIKRGSAFQINRSLNREGPLWQAGYYEHVIRDSKDLKARLDYIHKNPLNTSLVKNLEDYPFTSYRNYYLDDNSILAVDKIFVEAG